MFYPRLGFVEMIYVLLLIISTVYKGISLELETMLFMLIIILFLLIMILFVNTVILLSLFLHMYIIIKDWEQSIMV